VKVVIVGPRDRQELIYTRLVNEIIDDVKHRYPKVLIVTKSCDQGVGKIIRNRCLAAKEVAGVMQYDYKNPEFDMLELSLRHYLIQELPQSEFQSNFDTLNLALVALGDEFHLIVEEPTRGSMENLVNMVKEKNLPHVTYGPADLKNGPKQPKIL
jgi:hypothetical protein